MDYKAIMLDVDGTLVPYDFAALPSEKVAQAVKKASEKVAVCIVTGREYGFIRKVLKKLGITSGYAVVNNGANVVDIATETLLYDQPIEMNEAEKIIQVLQNHGITFHIKDDFDDRTFIEQPFGKEQELKKAYMFYVAEEYPEHDIDAVFNDLTSLSHITLYKTNHKDPNSYGLNITHGKATKLHGIEVILKQLGLKNEEIIGVGDSYNDFSLLMACGLKVAMGNAIEDLKAIADYVAPSVTEDGVADVINKFILTK